MINAVISFSIKNKLIIGLFTLLLLGWGVFSLTQLSIDAVPDITNNQVQIITTSPTLAAQEVEQFITYPVELAMANLPGVQEIRSISRFGLSVVTVVFDEDQGTYLPRQLVLEQLQEAKENIDDAYGTPRMGPISTGLGEIYQYTLEVKPGYEQKYNPTELRSIQDWLVKRQLSGVPGVVEISSWGGFLKQYEVAVRPEKLNSYQLSMSDILTALENNNQNTGGSYIEKGPELYYIRGKGLVGSLEDIRNIVVTRREGIPVTIADVATVGIGHAPRYGAATQNGQGETVVGIVMMLKDANTAEVVDAVKGKVSQIQKTLPEGVVIKPFVDRTDLINRTTSTIEENLLIGGLIVIFALVLLLGNFRSGLIVASVIPLSMLFALGMMHAFDLSANLMSLGALDFGIIVDGAVIIVEFMAVRLVQKNEKLRQLKGPEKQEAIDAVAYDASGKMMNSAIFGQVIIIIVFLPILTLTGIEGKMFRPMALTFIFALLGAMILCLTYVPMISSLLLFKEKKPGKNWGDKIMHRLESGYKPIIAAALRAKAMVLGTALAFLALAVVVFLNMGGEFIPSLDEGDFALETRMAPGTSLSEMIENMGKLEKILQDSFPEVETVVTKIGSGEVPTDPTPIEGADIMVGLKNREEWVTADTPDELAEKMEEALAVLPGLSVEFSQPIEMRFNELISGVKSDVAVKIYGEDLDVLQEKGNRAASLIQDIPGAADVRAEQVVGLPQIVVNYKRNRLAQYGLSISTINQLVSTAFSGTAVGVFYEGEKRFDLVVRLPESLRHDIGQVRHLYVPLPGGVSIPLQEVADVVFEEGPAQISREDTQRRIVVGINVRNRDTESLVTEIQSVLDKELELPTGYYISYGGQFENLKRAKERLSIVIPIALALIFIILFISLRSFQQTLLIYTAIPFAAIGGVLALWIRDMPFSISAGVGFIALFGVAVLNGLVLIDSLNELKSEGVMDLKERILMATSTRLRPIFLTASTDILGFLPMAISSSAGGEVQRPLATVVIGGLLSATVLSLVVLPVLYSLVEKNEILKKVRLSKGALLLCLLLTVWSVPGVAQEKVREPENTVSFQQTMQWAEDYAPLLQAAKLNVAQQRELKKTAFNPPNTGFFYSEDEVALRHLPGDIPQSTAALGISQSFSFPTVYLKRSKVFRQQVQLSGLNLLVERNELYKTVATTYFNWAIAWKKRQYYQTLDSIYSRFYEAAEIKYRTGETSVLVKMTAQSQLQQVKLKIQAARADMQSARVMLRRWTGRDLEEGIRPQQLMAKEPDTFLVGESFEANPSLSYQAAQVVLREKQLALERSRLLPGLNAQYSWQTVNQETGFYGWQVGINLPLWFRPRQGQIESAKIEKQIQQQQLLNQQLALQARSDSAYVQLRQLQQQLTYFEELGIPLSQELIKGANTAFEAGEIGYVEYLQNIEQATALQLAWFDAINSYNRTTILLTYLQGNLLKE